MPRTTSGPVQKLLMDDYNLDDLPSLDPFIETANAVVSRVSAYATANSLTVTSVELELMERWLSAHFYAMSDQPLAESETQKAMGVFQGRTGMYLEGTKYGQTALNLDFTGALSAVTSQNRVGGFWLGTTDSEALTYDERN